MPFIPNSDQDRHDMLKAIGVETFSDLIRMIPDDALFEGELDLPEPLNELEVRRTLDALSRENENCDDHICFLGGGAYDHYVPAAVKHIIQRSEFYTAYTPYQPEVSQGTLQSIYEYQTMICELTGMDVANASMYDGGSALAEAALLACATTRRNTILVSATVNPNYVEIIKTYCHGRGINVVTLPRDNHAVFLQTLEKQINDRTAAVIFQHPNYLGYFEPVEEIARLTKESGALLISSNDPISLTVLRPPADYGVDIATGEGQALGNPLSYGGPYLGIFASDKKFVRKIPGRIVGKTVDKNGQPGFVLTLQTREQHIRREKATSNICTNQGLNALAATVYMALMGKQGLPEVATQCLQKSHYLAGEISKLDGFGIKFDAPFFKEFVVQTSHPVDKVMQVCRENKVFAGIPLKNYDDNLSDCFLCAVTEKRTKKEMDAFINILRELL
ncbi:MAG: aminomethyl-transferring glycine dehydrogenase subunit GcvPA [candidate division KSB1 bacterium]|nr:aminomethyl-transferring glycine dehydrogenase subunit GcvPA [candidate division KSB1 bacterium]